jgi:NADH-quinone oxidoreductase subunit N
MSFTYTVTAADWGRVAPELVLAVMALITMLADLILPQGEHAQKAHLKEDARSLSFFYLLLPVLCLVGLVGAIIATVVLFQVGDHLNAFNNMIGSDQGSLYADLIILSAAILGILLSPSYLKRLEIPHQGEYYALFLLGTIGMMLLASATSFLTVFLGLEMLSLALYILCGYVSRRTSSQESGMKYFLLSSFASAFLLYGIALIYGATGNTTFAGILKFLTAHHPQHTPLLLLLGMGLLTVGFSFKISAVPFQAWTPDVYEGAPTPVTAFMSVGTKTAALVAFARVFVVVLQPVHADWMPVVWAITILTIVGGNVMALVQSNVKRLLAYSSIAHAGYLMIGIVAGGISGLSAILFYLLCYTFMNIGAFGVLSLLESKEHTGSNISDLRGLWYRRPTVAGLLAFFLLALAGFPPMAGFAGKYYIFLAGLQGGHPELLILGVLASILGMYYYLKVIAAMFMDRPEAVAEVAPAVAASDARPSGRPEGPARGGVAAAVAVKTETATSSATKVSRKLEQEQFPYAGWTSWLAVGLAALGTLLMGTALPFWLVDLAIQAAKAMM